MKLKEKEVLTEKEKQEGEEYFSKCDFLENGNIRVYDSLGESLVCSPQQYRLTINKRKERKERVKKVLLEQKDKPMPEKRYKRLVSILHKGFNNEFERIAKNPEEYGLSPLYEIKITKEAMKKANLITKRQLKINGENEVHLSLVNKKEKRDNEDFSIRDVLISYGQLVTPTTCGCVGDNGKTRTKDELEMQGKYIAGWAHSHSTMGVFHSSYDKNYLKEHISEDTPITKDMEPTEISLKINPFVPDEKGKIDFKFKFLPSLVFNARGSNPDKAIQLAYPCLEQGKSIKENNFKYYLNESPKLVKLNEKNNINLEVNKIDKQLQERVFTEMDDLAKVHYEPLLPHPKVEQTEEQKEKHRRKLNKIFDHSKKIKSKKINSKDKSIKEYPVDLEIFDKRTKNTGQEKTSYDDSKDDAEVKIRDNSSKSDLKHEEDKKGFFKIPNYLQKIIDMFRKTDMYQELSEKITILENNYCDLDKKYKQLEGENSLLKKRVKSLESIVGGN